MLLRTIEVPKFPTQVKLTNSRRPKYYNKFKGKIPKKYLNKGYSFNNKGFLINEQTGKRVQSNEALSKRPRYAKLNGNSLITGYGSPHIRNKITWALKDFYSPIIEKHLLEEGPLSIFPLRLEWDVYTIVGAKDRWDASNLFFYYKYFEDTMVKEFPSGSLIPDDNIKYVTHPPSPKIIPVDDWENRKFIFRIYHDDRSELRRTPWV